MAYKDNGAWVGSFYYKDISGKRKRKRKKGFKTKKEAKEWEVQNGYVANEDEEIISSNFITFKQLADKYIDSLKNVIKPTSIERYKTAINLFEHYHKANINNITSQDIRDFQNDLLKNGYKTITINNTVTVLSSIFYFGIDNYSLKINPIVRVKRLKDFDAEEKIKYIKYNDYKKFEKVIDDIVYKSFFMFLFYTGARRGEAQAIDWNDVNFNTKTLTINKTLNNKTKGKNYVITVPKTKNSKRKFKLPDNLIEQLKLLKSHYKKQEGFNENWFIFGGINPLKDTTIETRKNKYFEKAKLQPIKIHEFRHSHASLLINEGVSISVVQKRLGHASISTTMDIYSSLYEETLDKATEKLNKL